MAFPLAEAFVQFTTRGFEAVMAQVRSLGGSLNSIGGNFTVAQSGLNRATASAGLALQSMTTLRTATAGATAEFNRLGASANNAFGSVAARGKAFRFDALPTPAAPVLPTSNALPLAAVFERDFSAARRVVAAQTESLGQQLRRAATGFTKIFAATGLGGAGVGQVASLGSQAQLLAGIPVAITAAVGAAAVGIGIIGYAFKEALAVDPEAQRQLSELGRSIKNLAAQIGEPLLDSVQRILTPLAKVVDRLADLVDLMNNFKPPRWLEFLGNMGAGATGIAIELLQLLDQFGLLGEANAAGGKPADQRGASFVALEQFTKNLQSDANQKDDARKAREALEEIARNGVRIKNPMAGPQFAPALA